MWRTNERVLASRPPDSFLYPGTVYDTEGSAVHITFDDGLDTRVPAAQVRPLQIEAGDRVQVRLPATRSYTPAAVLRRDGDRLHVEFEDGEHEATSLGMVRIDPDDWKGRAAPRPGHSWIVGDRVLAKWGQDPFWYPGTVQALEGERLHVYYDDGYDEWLTPERVAPLDLKAGDRVFGRWRQGEAFYPGQITSRDGEKIHIRYDDGDQETTTLSLVRVRRGAGANPWRVGQRVLAQWGPEPFYYPGVVGAVNGDVISIQYDDGDRAAVMPEQVLPLRLDVGDRVYARWQRGPYYYPGRIARKNGDDLLVQYDDGRQEWTRIEVVRVLPQEVAAAHG
jgi:hypothetical protein